MENLSNGQKIALGGGLVLLISSFLPWYGLGPLSVNAWDSGFLAVLGVVLGVLAAGLLAMKAFQNNAISLGGFATEQLAVLLGGIATVLILLRLILNPFGSEAAAAGVGRKFGLFVGLLAAAATAYGAFMSMREAGLDLDVDDFKGKLGGGGTNSGDETPPPPPPVP